MGGRMKFNPDNHITGKVYDLTQENMNAMIAIFEELQRAYNEQEEELDATMMAFNILKKENEQLHAILTSIKQSLIEISIQSEGTVMAIDEIEYEKKINTDVEEKNSKPCECIL
jgi:hemoglobin-like flavoprotein